jgi:hypothetical protein
MKRHDIMSNELRFRQRKNIKHARDIDTLMHNEYLIIVQPNTEIEYRPALFFAQSLSQIIAALT